MTYQLWLGSQRIDDVVDRIVAAAAEVAPTLDPAAARALVGLAFCTRVRQTAACGTAPACRPDGPEWETGTPAAGETCAWVDPDPQNLPAMLAAGLADMVPAATPAERRALEPALAMSIRGVFAPLLFRNRRCGHAAICRSEAARPLLNPRPR